MVVSFLFVSDKSDLSDRSDGLSCVSLATSASTLPFSCTSMRSNLRCSSLKYICLYLFGSSEARLSQMLFSTLCARSAMGP